jgi:hypothetical protein
MGYAISDRDGRQWVRLINVQGKRARVCKPFETTWTCDPCARTRERYHVRHTAGYVYHAWWEVITNADNARERAAKLRHANQVITAAQTLAAAEKEYRDLVS